jgi:predicted enzyme related to lactoylglutathione lyase
MADDNPKVGSIVWIDLTVDKADEMRDFYKQVVGWDHEAVEMSGYSDFNMLMQGTDKPMAGICNARETNANLPAKWLIYIVVADLEESVKQCIRLGGEVLVKPGKLGGSRFSVIRDPAGAVAALYQPAPAE